MDGLTDDYDPERGAAVAWLFGIARRCRADRRRSDHGQHEERRPLRDRRPSRRIRPPPRRPHDRAARRPRAAVRMEGGRGVPRTPRRTVRRRRSGVDAPGRHRSADLDGAQPAGRHQARRDCDSPHARRQPPRPAERALRDPRPAAAGTARRLGADRNARPRSRPTSTDAPSAPARRPSRAAIAPRCSSTHATRTAPPPTSPAARRAPTASSTRQATSPRAAPARAGWS
jgi:hypothetical protein